MIKLNQTAREPDDIIKRYLRLSPEDKQKVEGLIDILERQKGPLLMPADKKRKDPQA